MTHLTLTSRALAAALIGATSLTAIAPAAQAAESKPTQEACLVAADDTMTCYPTERALDRAHPELVIVEAAADRSTEEVAAAAACSSSVRLYTGTSYTGSVYVYTARQQTINLQAAINNQTSSYRVGACAATFYENSNLGGAIYPGSTAAGAQATSMTSGWDNRISSIWIA